jgi:hypothetical protein
VELEADGNELMLSDESLQQAICDLQKDPENEFDGVTLSQSPSGDDQISLGDNTDEQVRLFSKLHL